MDLESVAKRCATLATALETWLTHTNDSEVYWIEVDQVTDNITLKNAPLNVGVTLQNELYNRVPCCIFTSATLSICSPPDFSFPLAQLGLEDCKTISVQSPFNYRTQCKLHLNKILPDPSKHRTEYETQMIAAIPHYLDLSKGRAFVLFTSRQTMLRAVPVIRSWANGQYTILVQGEQPTIVLIEHLKNDTSSILLGLDTFWMGVDVPGEALSNVILTKLPFRMPSHPLYQAKLDAITDAGGNSFMDYTIPEAIIKLKQGYGRLIRNGTDTGLVVILDPRVLTQPYGKIFLNSLPNCNRKIITKSFADLVEEPCYQEQ